MGKVLCALIPIGFFWVGRGYGDSLVMVGKEVSLGRVVDLRLRSQVMSLQTHDGS